MSFMIEELVKLFPRFAALATSHDIENVLPPSTAEEIGSMETRLGVSFPTDYKSLLSVTRGFWLMGGVVQFGRQHPFFHEFERLESLTAIQQQSVRLKGGHWPPPSQGMLCFAEFFMEDDGDQVLFDVSSGLVAGEYPVMYYSHEDRPPSVRRLAQSFKEFMENFLNYPEFACDEDE